MYCALDGAMVIAFHDEERVVQEYCDIIHKYHKKNLSIAKIKKKTYKNLKDMDELYLVRYGDTYVQNGYLPYLEFMPTQLKEDHVYAKDTILGILETIDLSEKDRHTLEKAAIIINNLIDQENEYIPDFQGLKRMKYDFEPYLNNKGIWN